MKYFIVTEIRLNEEIYIIKTRLICIYMFVCSELIEETGKPPGLILGMWRYFWAWLGQVRVLEKFSHI